VNERTAGGVPFVKDKIESRYSRPPEQIVQAAKQVILANGSLVNEETIYGATNQVRTLQGKVTDRNVWIRVEPVDPTVTKVIVQTRTPGGLSDIDLTAQIDKEIALKLVR
jgi:hypothetical protein